jgi:D-serine deaminase-like pyridoxal phosphate-dependent protein
LAIKSIYHLKGIRILPFRLIFEIIKSKNETMQIENIEEVDSPSLVLYEEIMEKNLMEMISMVEGDTERLIPHVKTNKMPRVIRVMVSMGITNFKASTIGEAEMAAMEKAKHVLIAHQLVGPKIDRFITLIRHYPSCTFSSIIDNIGSLNQMNEKAIENRINVEFYIDLNTGMNRSGIEIGKELHSLIEESKKCKNLILKGLHAYDGHIHDQSFEERNNKIETGFEKVEIVFEELKHQFPEIKLISGGTPAFTSHLLKKNRICSPGTCVFWDWGYADMLPEQNFRSAVLLVTRVISKPTEGIVTIDLGHKAVASENPIHKRVKFINLKDYELLSQSEEHGVLKVKNWQEINIGDVFYGIPFHICPTVNLHDEVSVIKNNLKIDTWQITARRRKINF